VIENWGPQLEAVIHVLQTALTPAFLLVAVGSLLNVLTGRLSRIVDRSRDLQAKHDLAGAGDLPSIVTEQRIMERRMRVVGRSILLSVLAAVMVCIMIGLLFLMGLTDYSEPLVIVGVFVLALVLLSWALLAFVHEVWLATAAIQIPEKYLTVPDVGKSG
jgi:hypothetical protein